MLVSRDAIKDLTPVRLNYIDNCDCLEGMKQIPDGSVDMILCDLPYGTTACKWDTVIPFEPLWEQYTRVIKEHGAIVLFANEPFASKLRMSNLEKYRYDWIWEKENGTNFATVKYQPFRKTERILVFGDFATSYNKSKPKNYNPQFSQGEKYSVKRKGKQREQLHVGANKATEFVNDGFRYPTDIIRFNAVKKGTYLHPTQKPVSLLEYLVKTYTNPGEVVLDNCMGSGTTAVACIRTGRNYIGFELDERYHAIALQRIAAEPPSP